jgi:hypothetical protein
VGCRASCYRPRTMPTDQEEGRPVERFLHLDERKRQVARRMRHICPDIQDEELELIVDRIARMELSHESGQLGSKR